MNNSDFLSKMEHSALGSRLKRTGLAMQAVTQTWLQAQGCDMPSAQMPVLAVLHFNGPVTTGELAQMLGIAQPGASRLIDQMTKAGWVEIEADPDDRRIRRIVLTDTGREMGERAGREFWPKIDKAVSALCGELTGGLLGQLTQLETRLAAGDLQRLFEREIEKEEGRA